MKFDFVAYMRNIAIKLKEIQHVEGDKANNRFYRVEDIDKWHEVFQKISEFGKFNILAEDNAEGGLVPADSLHKRQICTFFIVKKTKLNNATDREQVIKDCEKVMDKIISKFYKDSLADNSKPMNERTGLANIDFSSWQYNTFGPVFDNYIGLNVVFSVINGLNAKFNPDDWLE